MYGVLLWYIILPALCVCGVQVVIGNREWMKENHVAVSTEVERRITGFEEYGQTVVLVAFDGEPVEFDLSF